MNDSKPLEAAQVLAAIPVFAALTPVDRAKLAGALEQRVLEAGTVVFEAGGEGDALFILGEGTAERRVAGASIDLIEPPAIFGELALLTDEPRSASIIAVTPIRLWVLPRQRFQRLLHSEPELMLRLSTAIGVELARTRRMLGEQQREFDHWIEERLAALPESAHTVVLAAALFERPPQRVLARLAGADATTLDEQLEPIVRHSPFLERDARGLYVPPAIRTALRRRRADARQSLAKGELLRVAGALETEGALEEAIPTYLAVGAEEDARRVLDSAPEPIRATLAAAGVTLPREPAVPAIAKAADVPAPGRAAARKLASRKFVIAIVVSLVPFLFWNVAPPEGLSPAGWRALIALLSAALLFAFDILPDAIVALALVSVWVVGGLVAPRTALDGFASQSWLLVLTVLAVGVAVGKTGLLYRVALAALGRRRTGLTGQCLTLALVGTAVTPMLPNATSRMALAAPVVREVAEALGYDIDRRASTAIALAALIGFGQMAALFLTGSSVGLLVYGLLPPSVQAEFGFARWFLVALPLHVVLFALSMFALAIFYRPAQTAPVSGDRLALQRAVLGRMRRDELVCLVVLLALIAGFLTEPLHGVNGAWLGVTALVVLAVAGIVDANMLRTGVNWTFLVFFGVITTLSVVFAALKIDVWIAARVAGPIQAVAGSGIVFCLALTVIGFALSFVVRWQAAAPLLTLVAIPAGNAAGVHSFVVALIAIVATQGWFLPYQSTIYLALYHGSGELFTHRDARVLAWLWGAIVLVAVLAAAFVWRAMGLVS